SADKDMVAGLRSRFAQVLRHRMQELTLSGRELAARLQVATATVSYWRQGLNVPKGTTLQTLATTLQLPLERLLPEGEYSASNNAPNALTRWLTIHGLWGKLATEKQIPDCV